MCVFWLIQIAHTIKHLILFPEVITLATKLRSTVTIKEQSETEFF